MHLTKALCSTGDFLLPGLITHRRSDLKQLRQSWRWNKTYWAITRAGNSLIGFLSELLVFCKKWANERFAQKNKQFARSLIFGERPERFAHGHSFLVSDLMESLLVAHFWWATWAICSHRLFLVSNLSNLLTSFIKNERMSNWLNNFWLKNLKSYFFVCFINVFSI